LFFGPAAGAAEIKVFAASSLTDSMRDIARNYQTAQGVKIVLNLGASSTLARQIEEGAPADLFLSADEAKMDALDKKKLIVRESRKSLLSNQLVIVVPSEQGAAIRSPQDLADGKITRIALGDPKAAPIGIYAREYLEKLGLWETIRPKVVITENVRAALAAVEAGNAEASIVYKTDAAVSRKVKVAFEVPVAEGPRISYPFAVVTASETRAAAEKFLAYLDSMEARTVFRKYGFIVKD
jgi:molybdate transport system substrate-binding protein